MPKSLHSRNVNSLLMGAGAVLGGLHAFKAQDPALRDTFALRRDQLVLAGDFRRAVKVLSESAHFDIAPDLEEASDKSNR